MTRRSYYGKNITVTFDKDRCLHAAECVRGLPEVFDIHRKPWILPDASEAETIAEVVRRCPTGALEYGPGTDQAGARPERGDEPTTIAAGEGAPLWLRGDIVITGDDSVDTVYRAALCHCGMTANGPHCDGSGPCLQWRDQ
jgi:uncharacterized Fe-S cluster protein YjdI